jgi:long-chain acyl-CoA synthetase
MRWRIKTRQDPPISEAPFLGRTLPSLLDEGCERAVAESAKQLRLPFSLHRLLPARISKTEVFHEWTASGWQSFSNLAVRSASEDLALGLQQLGLNRGDRIAFLLHSDVQFCIADMGSLLAGLVNVPIDLTQTLENIIAILQHSEAKVLMTSNFDLLKQIMPFLSQAALLQHVIVVQVPVQWGQQKLQASLEGQPVRSIPSPSACLSLSAHLQDAEEQWPYCATGIQVWSLAEVQRQGQRPHPETQLEKLRVDISPQDLATLIYIPDGVGQLQAVMLTHENISANALAAFSSLNHLKRGPQEAVLSFLPLNHIFARTLLYGHMAYGHCIYFTTPNRVMKHLQDICPTILATVPLFLEKIYGKLLEAAYKPTRFKFQPWIHGWGLKLAQRYELGRMPTLWDGIMLKLADPLVFARWRSLFGGRLKYLLSGGAALNGDITNLFGAAGIRILQGYGLTQTSAVVCVNRERINYAGTVGLPIAGAEVKIAPDGEILVRGPSVTPGYFKNPALTRTLIDPHGWLHTGDLGVFTTGGCLKVTGLKKDLFKLATGKYIAPIPIEQRLKQSPLVAQAIVVGADRKFCGALIFPNWQALRQEAQKLGLTEPTEALLHHPWILNRYQSIVEAANCHLPYWAAVKQFRLLPTALTLDRGLITPIGQIQRAAMIERFATEIEALYGSNPPDKKMLLSPPPPIFENEACPVFAQSLNPKFTT